MTDDILSIDQRVILSVLRRWGDHWLTYSALCDELYERGRVNITLKKAHQEMHKLADRRLVQYGAIINPLTNRLSGSGWFLTVKGEG